MQIPNHLKRSFARYQKWQMEDRPSNKSSYLNRRFACSSTTFSIVRSFFGNSYSSQDGGAILVRDWASIAIIRCSFVNCTSGIRGGACYLADSLEETSSLNLHENCFITCEAKGASNSGGAFLAHGNISATTLTLYDIRSSYGSASFRGCHHDIKSINSTFTTCRLNGQHLYINESPSTSVKYSMFTKSYQTISNVTTMFMTNQISATFSKCNIIENECAGIVYGYGGVLFDACVFTGTALASTTPGTISVTNSVSDREFEGALKVADYSTTSFPAPHALEMKARCAKYITRQFTRIMNTHRVVPSLVTLLFVAKM